MGEKVANRQEIMLEEIASGLSRPQKSIPSKYFYDERGSELFEQITRLEEYYPTRTEIGILRDHMGEIAGEIASPADGSAVALLELGSGSSKKTRLLLDHLDDLAAYIPVDISEEYLLNVGDELKREYPEIDIKPVIADYTEPFELPRIENGTSVVRWIAYYPGSTIGNFVPEQAKRFLEMIAETIGPSGGLLIGVDLKKDRERLERAYNDAEGVTARFNKNLLRRINREIGADFRIDQFEHKAFYNEAEGRIEMHLVSREPQSVHLDGETFHLKEGESIHTENSYKYSLDEFERLVSGTYEVENVWTDEEQLFSVQYCTVKGEE